MNNESQTKQLVRTEEKSISFVPFGSQDKINLSISIVKRLCCTPTKSGKVCDDNQAMKFVMLCSAQHLNPFAGDAFLIGYDGKDGPQFSLITAHQAFLKRAEASPHFDGMESGVILRQRDGDETSQVEGDYFDDSQWELVGAWARVHHKQHKIPTLRRGALKTFRKPFGLWSDPANHAMMLVKCVEADALRSTFPTMLGGLYTQGETIELEPESPASRMSRLVAVTQPDQQEEPKPVAEPAPEKLSPNAELEQLLTSNGYIFPHLVRWAIDTANIKDADSLTGFQDIPAKECERLLRAKAGLLKGLQAVKEAA